ncbi:hypothetical protein SDC9_109374 [bioreactor metagenome]|uniref:Uncharacterized protein n=1 Tax=bioreactor metagenome TaxID=1076179 RepID=A0A645BCY1_9ZZZZ
MVPKAEGFAGLHKGCYHLIGGGGRIFRHHVEVRSAVKSDVGVVDDDIAHFDIFLNGACCSHPNKGVGAGVTEFGQHDFGGGTADAGRVGADFSPLISAVGGFLGTV